MFNALCVISQLIYLDKITKMIAAKIFKDISVYRGCLLFNVPDNANPLLAPALCRNSNALTSESRNLQANFSVKQTLKIKIISMSIRKSPCPDFFHSRHADCWTWG